MNTRYSAHARRRAQQRAVSPLIVDWLLEFGAETFDKSGSIIHYFDKQAKKRLQRAYGREAISRFRDKLSTYLVECDGKVITIGYRFQRIRRN